MKVLYAEDNVDIQVTTQWLLERRGHQVVAANDGHEAHTLLLERPKHFDLLLTDVEMPRVNGLELVRRVRNDENCKHLKIAVFSGNNEKKQNIIRAGADLFLLKGDVSAAVNLFEAIERWSSLR